MKIKDQELWDKAVSNNRDPYGSGVIRFAERWADLMEAAIKQGEPLDDCANRTNHEANEEGITGFMYGAAVSILSNVWENGEQLRRWHNLDTQIGDEGEKANANGGTLNPALLNIGKS